MKVEQIEHEKSMYCIDEILACHTHVFRGSTPSVGFPAFTVPSITKSSYKLDEISVCPLGFWSVRGLKIPPQATGI